MLRKIVGPRRASQEPWVDWIVHSTTKAREIAKKSGIRFWVPAHLHAKWSWAGKLMNMLPVRIARKTTEWRDSCWWRSEQQL
eukprot:1731636-Karenia_brevis.AAC.1